MISLHLGHRTEVRQGRSDHPIVAELAPDVQALLEQPQPFLPVSLLEGDVAQSMKDAGGAQPVVDAPVKGKALLIARPSGGVITATKGQEARRAGRPGPDHRRRSRALPQSTVQPPASLSDMAPHLPEPSQCRRKSESGLAVSSGRPPLQGGSEVVVLGLERLEPRLLSRTVERSCALLSVGAAPVQVLLPDLVILWRRLQILEHVTTDIVREVVPVRLPGLKDDRAAHQVGHQVVDGHLIDAGGGRDVPCPLEREASDEHRDRDEERSLALGEIAVDAAHALVFNLGCPLGARPGAAGRQSDIRR